MGKIWRAGGSLTRIAESGYDMYEELGIPVQKPVSPAFCLVRGTAVYGKLPGN